MHTKLKLTVIFSTLLLAIMPLTAITANAMTFDLRIPSYGLYCENQNTDILGKVRYVIDENGKAVQYSEYTINGTDNLNLYIPFISNAFQIPKIDITVNQKTVTGEVCYGENYFENEQLNFYSADIDESITGTLYTLTTDAENLTVNFTTYDKQNYIYFLPSDFFQSSGNRYSYNAEKVQSGSEYFIYSLNGDFAEFESNAYTVKETLTLKEYIARTYDELSEFYSNCGNIKTDFFYSLANKMLESNSNCEFSDMFIDSISEQRINAYKINLQTDTESNVIAYSMSADVQKNNVFNPAIFMIEQTATGNYKTDYTIELNSELPYIIESSAEIQKQSDYIYTAQNVADDFYFIFSSSDMNEGYAENSKSPNNTLKIALSVIFGVALCALITINIVIILRYKKRNR